MEGYLCIYLSIVGLKTILQCFLKRVGKFEGLGFVRSNGNSNALLRFPPGLIGDLFGHRKPNMSNNFRKRQFSAFNIDSPHFGLICRRRTKEESSKMKYRLNKWMQQSSELMNSQIGNGWGGRHRRGNELVESRNWLETLSQLMKYNRNRLAPTRVERKKRLCGG